MSNVSTTRPLGELDLGDERRLYPVRMFAEPSRRNGIERRFLDLQLLELVAQLHAERVGPSCPGSDLAGEAQRVSLVVTNQNRSDAAARPLRIGEPADNELLALRAFALLPVARPRPNAIRP